MAPLHTHEFTPSKRGRILALREEGYNYREIAAKVGCAHSTAQKTVKRDQKYDTRKSLPRPGRPCATNPQTKGKVLRSLQNNRWEPYGKIANRFRDVKEHQVRGIAWEAGYRRCVARRKPFLTTKAVQKRQEWAIQNKGRTWSNIIWTDEASIETGERPGPQRVTRRPHEEYLPENIAPTFRSGRQSIMVWACITHNKKGPIIRVNTVPETTSKTGRRNGGGLNGPRYVEQILVGPLKEFLEQEEKNMGQKMLIVEDGAPSHRSVVAKHARIDAGFTNLTHPPSSPDLNPIEPLWFVLKKRVADIPGSGNSLDALWAAVQRAWGEITVEDIRKYTGQMDDRVEAVREANGWHTKF